VGARPSPPPQPRLPAALAGDAGFLIGKLAQRGSALLEARLESAGFGGLRARHVGTLAVLAEIDHATQRDLGEQLRIDRTTTTATVDDLVGRGLVARLPHPHDRRAHAVSLTADGRRAVTRIRRLADEANGDLLAALPAGERARLVALVAKALD
jgi:DNA-binding MarR family transcriptional regulator